MFVRHGARITKGAVAAVIAPAWLVQTEQTEYTTSRTEAVARVTSLSLVWLANVVLYAAPLALAGIGFTGAAAAPPWFSAVVSPVGIPADSGWQLAVGTVQNSIFLTAGTAVIFVTFHASVLAVERSRGYLQSLYTVVYSTSVYLVGIFTLTMYASTTAQVATAREFLVTFQLLFIQTTLDLFGFGLTAGDPDPAAMGLDGLSAQGELLLAGILLFALYFLYSMYLGARLNHDLNRFQSSLVVGGVLFAPVLYIVGSALFSLAVEGLLAGTATVITAGWSA